MASATFEDHPTDPDRVILRKKPYLDKTCPDCERYKLSASMWRNEAYKHAGVELPWNPEELLRKEYERGFIDGMQEQLRRVVDKKVKGQA